ncbi:hypothetical protein GCM10009633_19410 [Janibacter melonis]|uniref:RHS repeat-associated core domain-containing protein n=1 Tax=Janibacter melonis TaxID=262209 RepID=UPI001E29FD14|nr:RHS repeat-associated core domain-containing protein [Janibacter melonis]MCB5991744.1 hypothetical protein [Janibacter melonis]
MTVGRDGRISLAILTPTNDQASTVTIPVGQGTSTSATGLDAWTDYTEYGIPKDAGAMATTTGHNGYGWQGGAQRSTTASFSAGLTQMGVRWYNPRRGAFTSPDAVIGGNTTAYTYPDDPINWHDITGLAEKPDAGGGGRGGAISVGEVRSIGGGQKVVGQRTTQGKRNSMTEAGQQVKRSRYKNGQLTSGTLGRIGEAGSVKWMHGLNIRPSQRNVRYEGGSRIYDLTSYDKHGKIIYYEIKVNGSRLTARQAYWDHEARAEYSVRYIWMSVDRWTGQITSVARGGDW